MPPLGPSREASVSASREHLQEAGCLRRGSIFTHPTSPTCPLPCGAAAPPPLATATVNQGLRPQPPWASRPPRPHKSQHGQQGRPSSMWSGSPAPCGQAHASPKTLVSLLNTLSRSLWRFIAQLSLPPATPGTSAPNWNRWWPLAEAPAGGATLVTIFSRPAPPLRRPPPSLGAEEDTPWCFHLPGGGAWRMHLGASTSLLSTWVPLVGLLGG